MDVIRLVGALTLALCAAAGPAAAQNADPMVDSASLWDLDHNGTYTCDEWKQYASRIFNLADRNHDGWLDAEEFKAVQKAAPMLKEADFAYFDDNHDGRVSRDEFVRKPNPLFARYDKNGDCKITPEELKGTATTQGAPPAGKRGLGGGGR
jgi:Ca2+-binding EF-hand superfamily protein